MLQRDPRECINIFLSEQIKERLVLIDWTYEGHMFLATTKQLIVLLFSKYKKQIWLVYFSVICLIVVYV